MATPSDLPIRSKDSIFFGKFLKCFREYPKIYERAKSTFGIFTVIFGVVAVLSEFFEILA